MLPVEGPEYFSALKKFREDSWPIFEYASLFDETIRASSASSGLSDTDSTSSALVTAERSQAKTNNRSLINHSLTIPSYSS
jgi:hypothetical protein